AGCGEDRVQVGRHHAHLADVRVGQLDRPGLPVLAQHPHHVGDGDRLAGLTGAQHRGERGRPQGGSRCGATRPRHPAPQSCNVLTMQARYRILGYFAGATSARTADEMSAPALLLLGLAIAGSARTAALLYAGLTVTAAAGGPPLGALLDRAGRPGRLLGWALGGYAAGLAAITGSLGDAPVALLVAVAAAAGVPAPALAGGWTSRLADVVPAGQLSRGHALDAATYNVACLAGPALAALIAADGGARWAMATAIALLVLAVPAAAGMPGRAGTGGGKPPPPHPGPAGGPRAPAPPPHRPPPPAPAPRTAGRLPGDGHVHRGLPPAGPPLPRRRRRGRAAAGGRGRRLAGGHGRDRPLAGAAPAGHRLPDRHGDSRVWPGGAGFRPGRGPDHRRGGAHRPGRRPAARSGLRGPPARGTSHASPPDVHYTRH